MANRRAFIAGLIASGSCALPTWADAGNPDYLSAARMADGTFSLMGLRGNGTIAFRLPLPDRGHAAAAHPTRPHAVAFARRPGTFALVIDCATGQTIAQLNSPKGRHFYGHGAFSPDGTYLFTTENDFEAAKGIIGVWNTRQGYTRVGEFSSGGIGPHDILLMPDGQSLTVANGGIETHPDSGRAKLNLATMRANLSYISLSGKIKTQAQLPAEWQRNSIRHLAVSQSGQVAIALQWQGETTANPPLVAIHQLGQDLRLIRMPIAHKTHFDGYAGSIAIAKTGKTVAITSPRGGHIGVFDTATGTIKRVISSQDVGGIALTSSGFVTTNGTGAFQSLRSGKVSTKSQSPWAWDNHLISIT